MEERYLRLEAGQETTWTIGKVLNAAKLFLGNHGSPAPRLEAEQLMAFTLKASRIDLYLQFARPLSQQERQAYKANIRARADGKPVQYIIGEQGFRRLVLKVTPDVLIPRPETELLVAAVMEQLKLNEPHATVPINILDVGTGSGAIALSIAYELEYTRLWALDISAVALKVARENSVRYSLEERVTFFQSDLFDGVKKYYRGKFDVIVSNPPYIAAKDKQNLPKDVLREPETALYSGATGLDFYRRLGRQAGDYLSAQGFLALEIADGRSGPVMDILREENFTGMKLIKDYNDRERIVLAWRADSYERDKSRSG